MKPYYQILILISLVLGNAASSLACPKRAGIPDVNCDQKAIIAFFGDSVTRGVGDPQKTLYSGGVPLRFKRYLHQELGLPSTEYKSLNFGFPGISCEDLKVKLRNAILDNKRNVANADVIIIACGLNDFWEHSDSDRSLAYIESMRRFIKKRGIFVDVAMLSDTNRFFQQPFVNELNKKLKIYGDRIRYYLIDSLTMLTGDNIHPNEIGYDFMFDIFKEYIFGLPFRKAAKLQQKLKDMDDDGVYDKFELSEFGTNPELFDTDGDGLSDSEELFIYNTDPLSTPTPSPTPTPIP
jgi:lysophospholipase L1-like esterase